MLEALYGNNAADRITSVEADMELVTFNPPLLIDNQVYFGLMLQPVNDPDAGRSARRFRWQQAGVFNIGQRVGSTVTITMQRSVGAQVAQIRLERDLRNNALAVYVNNEQVGPAARLRGKQQPGHPGAVRARGRRDHPRQPLADHLALSEKRLGFIRESCAIVKVIIICGVMHVGRTC